VGRGRLERLGITKYFRPVVKQAYNVTAIFAKGKALKIKKPLPARPAMAQVFDF